VAKRVIAALKNKGKIWEDSGNFRAKSVELVLEVSRKFSFVDLESMGRDPAESIAGAFALHAASTHVNGWLIQRDPLRILC
jgi:hypothetical protein